MAEGVRHHFTLSCNPEFTLADWNSDVLELQTHPSDIWLAESVCHLQMKIKHNTNNVD